LPNPSKLDALLRGIAGQAPEAKYIRAYHATPHDFDRFDFEGHMGRGEGNQSFGHGGYFAGSDATGEYYRRMLGENQERKVVGTDYLLPSWVANVVKPGEPADDLRQMFAERVRQSLAEARRPDAMQPWLARGNARRQVEVLRGLDAVAKGAPVAPGARVYEVEIGHPEDSLLDWDGPIGAAVASRLTPHMRASLERGLRERLDAGLLRWPYLQGDYADNIPAMRDDPALAPGVVLYEGMAADYAPSSASRKLLDAGIPGLRYLDANSRHLGQGTRNYVMFPGTEDSIRILRKYGIMAPIASGAAAEGE
jgi:hypothetical protein